MRAWEIGAQEGLDGLTCVERPDPVPGPGEALMRVSAVCLNHRDLLITEGRYGARKDTSRVPCSDGVGTVVALGPGTVGVSVGTRVVAPHFVGWRDGPFSMAAFGSDLGVTRDGWLAEMVVLPVDALVAIPEGRDDAWAAPMASAGATAWHAARIARAAGPGDVVLVPGTGGVSLFALQIAKLAGATAAITSSSDEKLARAKALGADIAINYRTSSDWVAELTAATGGKGADLIVDTAGYEALTTSIAAGATNGTIALIGALSGQPAHPIANFSMIIGKNLVLKGIASGSRAMLADLVHAFDASGTVPVIDSSFSFDDAPAAYRHLQSGRHFGKVMIKF